MIYRILWRSQRARAQSRTHLSSWTRPASSEREREKGKALRGRRRVSRDRGGHSEGGAESGSYEWTSDRDNRPALR